MRGYRFNGRGVARAIAGWIPPLAVVGLVGGFISVIVREETEKGQQEEARREVVENMPLDTRILGPGQIAATRGGLKYVFDFESGLIFVDAGFEQSSIKLHDFRNTELLNEIKRRGCEAPEGQPRLEAFVCG